MDSAGDSGERNLRSPEERAKELDCLYRIDEILRERGAEFRTVLLSVADAIPAGWQHPEVCGARLEVGEETVQTTGYKP
ncbi:MAG: hypothetical protein K8E66_14535, partial [Phycisphaerales bacterium]|nr:hypothetical protein [Phycisphaerales bacterium]